MKAELVPENGDPPIPIQRDVTIVGRREYCDVQVKDPSLSKRHCVLIKTDGLLVIRDLATTNGTKVKGQRIRWAALLPDDRISLGSYKARVYLGPDNAPAPSERTAAERAGSRRAEPAPAARAHKPSAAPASVEFPPPSLPNLPEASAGFFAGVKPGEIDDDLLLLEDVELIEDDVIELGEADAAPRDPLNGLIKLD